LRYFLAKKTPTAPTLAASTFNGTTTFTGKVTKDQNIGESAPFQSVTVSVSIPNRELYPLSSGTSVMGNSVFSGTTDVNGNFSITVSTTTSAIDAWVRFTPPPTSVYDPINGTLATFDSYATRYWFKAGSPVTAGVIDLGENTNVGTNVTGTATVLGNVYISFYQEITPGTPVGGSFKNFPLANETVSIDFYEDPTTGLPKTYTATTDAKGAYTLAITTTNAQGFDDYGNLYVINLNHTQDTITSAGATITGLPGYYSGTTTTINSLTPNAISNKNYLYFNNFHAN